jgi:N6-adenosine-specific RNA methylase IME4
MSELVRYEAARQALAEARRVDEVKDIRDKAVAMQAYARQAKDTELIDHATEIRLRAERRAGELLREMAERRERATEGERKGFTEKPLLADLGVTKTQSHRWQKLADLDDGDFEQRVEQAKRNARKTAPERAEEKKERRAEREAGLGAAQAGLPQKRYGVLYADPPWKFEVYSEDTGQGRAAESHYDTMPVEDIAKIDIPSLAADDCVLFLWATAPTLPEAFVLLAAWGFRYRTHCVWAKDKIGLGFWFRNQHEILIVAAKGDIPAPAHGTQWSSLIEAKRGAHSSKPDVFYELVDSYFPTLPKLELFARSRWRDWDVWGLEAPADAAE